MTDLGRRLLLVILPLLVLLTAGCASVDRKISLLYNPVSGATGGSGVLYLAASGTPDPCRASNLEWIVGNVKDSGGAATGEILSRVPPEELLLQALRSELSAAGYQVVSVRSLPPAVAKGVDVTRLVVKVDEVSGAFTAEAKSLVDFELAVWKNGSLLKKFRYNITMSDGAATGKDLLAARVLEKSLQQMMKQAVPEIVASLETAP